MTARDGLSSLVAAYGLVVGCAADPGPTCTPYAAPAATALVTRAEIDAIFARSCSFSTCHGVRPGSGQLYLPLATKGDWYPEVVSVPSVRAPKLARVAKGEPAASFLLLKLTDGLCAVACDGDCGARMPQNGDALPAADLQKLASWIRQGAAEK